jgi:ATP-dependent Clp protease ATP-binding subunit ClpA
MARTGEKYTEARRALGSSGSDGGRAGEDSGVADAWPEDSLGWFTDQAHNAILLATDEARMLSHVTVEPEHLLLALARSGNAQSLLLTRAGIDARAVHELILQIRGFGDRLELRPRRSRPSENALRGAVSAAAARGISGPSTEHLLIALGEHELPSQILEELAVSDIEALVDARYPVTRPPLPGIDIKRRASRLAAYGNRPPSPGPIPPIFERFTSQARDAANAGIEHARKLNDPYVEPVHLLFGVLHAQAGLVAALRSRYGWETPAAGLVPPREPQANHQQWTDIFSSDARRIVAEDVLVIAERLEQRALTTGHLLIAILESPDDRSAEITRTLADAREVAAAVIELLPREEET